MALSLSRRPTTTGPSSGGGGGERASGGGSNAERAQQVASAGVEGASGPMPHLDQIQASFGPGHDMSEMRAWMGQGAQQATSELGARGYATGGGAAFSGSPDLHTAAHEAAHWVMQGAGQGPSGVGQDGDSWERHADQVADRVVAGESAQDLLPQGGQSRQSSSAVQFDRDPPRKEVSSKAMTRLNHADKGIAETKRILSHGAGNQLEALKATNFNSYFRMAAMRDPECWELDPSLYSLARQYPDALTSAKGELAQGGNCGEHAQIAFDFLRRTSGDIVNRSDKEGLDHAFVVIGDAKGEGDDELVVCDPWPTAPTACLWEDHFAYTPDRSKLNLRNTSSGDDRDVKAALAAGLKLSRKGQRMVNNALSEEETKKEIDKGTEGDHPWIWQHPDAAGDKFTYHTAEEQDAGTGGQDEDTGIDQDLDPETQRYLEWLRAWS